MDSNLPSLSLDLPPVTDDAPPPSRLTGSFWRRILAFLVDGVFLWLVGIALGTAFFDAFSSMGLWARLVGFAIALFYFGAMNSDIGDGQTIGKRLLSLRVIDAQGYTLSFGKSIIRYSLLSIPFVLNRLSLNTTEMTGFISFLVAAPILGVGASTLYLLIFNRHGRQGLHDLLVGSYVANGDDTGPLNAKPIWKRHWVILSCLLAALLLEGAFANLLLSRGPFLHFKQDAEAIERMDDVQRASVVHLTFHDLAGGGTRKILLATVTERTKHTDQMAFSSEVAKLILQRDPKAQQYDTLKIVLKRGYNIGIASSWRSQSFAYSPDEWNRRVMGTKPASGPTLAK